MHELSIAHSLVELAADAAERAGVSRISVVHLRLGALAGVVRDALEFGFAIAADGTALAGARRLVVAELPVRILPALPGRGPRAARHPALLLPSLWHASRPDCAGPRAGAGRA